MLTDFLNTPLLSQAALFVIAFCLGALTGYLAHDIFKRSFNMDENSSKNFLLVTVTLIWAVSMLVDLASPAYDVPVAVHALMGAIVGFFFYRPKSGEGK